MDRDPVGGYKLSWEETDRESARPSKFKGHYDAASSGARGIYQVHADGVLVDQVGDTVQIKAGEFVRVLVGNDASKYAGEDWAYAVGESLPVKLGDRVESLRPNTLVAVLPPNLEYPK